jgi:tRNA modification GTPase
MKRTLDSIHVDISLIDLISVRDADIRLCVLSLPDIQKNAATTWKDAIPAEIRPLVDTDNTYFLLNKIDLVGSLHGFVNAQGDGTWLISLNTGSGTQKFLDGLQNSLKERLVKL